jgi:hypothetical protein
MATWQDRVIELKNNGAKWVTIARTLQAEYNRGFTLNSVRFWYYRHVDKADRAEPYKKPIIEEDSEYDNSQLEAPTYTKNWNGDKIIRFGLCGDAHIGSKFVQLGLLNKAFDIYEREGITDVYDLGDLTEGENMRPGHTYECYVHGGDEYVDEVIKNYPKRKGITTQYILGNHDMSFIKHGGGNIARPISTARSDMVYLGIEQAYVKLTPNCILELRHPGSGSAYAISYKPQKIIDAMPGGEKPNILAIGHFHKLEYLFYRNIHAFQTGTTQAQSNFMRNQSIAAHIGFWIITVYVNDTGEVTEIIPRLIPFYKIVKNDYENYR